MASSAENKPSLEQIMALQTHPSVEQMDYIMSILDSRIFVLLNDFCIKALYSNSNKYQRLFGYISLLSKHQLGIALLSSVAYCRTTSSEKMVEKLLKAGANVNHTDEKGNTPLIIASHFTNTTSTENIISFLLEAGADVNHKNKKGWTALMKAVCYSKMESTENTV